MIVTTAQLFKEAYGKYAVGAYNINNMEQALGLFQGHIQAQAPFIIQLSKGARKYAKARVLEAIIRKLAEQGTTVLITSHVLGPLVDLCDRIHLLERGTFTRSFERGKTEGLEAALFAELDARTRAVVDEWGSRRS